MIGAAVLHVLLATFNLNDPALKDVRVQGATHAKKKGDVLKLRGAGQEEPHIFHSSEQGIWFTGNWDLIIGGV